MELPAHDTTALSSSDTTLPSTGDGTGNGGNEDGIQELPVVGPSATDDDDDYDRIDEDFHDE